MLAPTSGLDRDRSDWNYLRDDGLDLVVKPRTRERLPDVLASSLERDARKIHCGDGCFALLPIAAVTLAFLRSQH